MKYQTEILTGLGIAGMISSVLLAITATPRAMKKLEKRKEELGVEKLSPLETVKTAGPCYIPTMAVMAASGVAMVKNTSDQMKLASNTTTALILEQEARRAFEEKTKEVIGEKKVNDIRDEIAKEHLAQHPVTSSEVLVTGRGKSLFYDPLVDKYYEYDIDEHKKIELKAKEETVNFMFISVNEWLELRGLRRIDPALGDLGWGPNTGFEMYLSYQAADDGRPCAVINYLTPPKPRTEAM